MDPRPGNVVVILADEHAPRFLGCSGHEIVSTPVLDRLASEGTRFTNAYTPSPICVPARASLATGRWVHRLGLWGSAEPYRGEPAGWAHVARDQGYRTASIGKLHFGAASEDHGFDEELLPMYIVNGVGWVQGLDRTPAAAYPEALELAAEVGVGESSYVDYDRRIAQRSVEWIEAHADDEEPWVLFVSFVSPHYPLTAPQEFWELYSDLEPPAFDPEIASMAETHPAVADVAAFFSYHEGFDEALTREGRRCYFALCSFVDAQVGLVLDALDASGAAARSTVLYTSDHGDMAGNRGLWCKSHMYEDSVGVPMIMRGPGVAAGSVCATPVSLVDVHATVVELVGGTDPASDGDSLLEIASSAYDPQRTLLSEYHDGGATAAFYMLRRGQWKYVYFVGAPPQLFDLRTDPDELVDLAGSPDAEPVCAEFEAELRAILDPEATNARALGDQAELLASFGGAAGLADALRFNHTPVPS